MKKLFFFFLSRVKLADISGKQTGSRARELVALFHVHISLTSEVFTVLFKKSLNKEWVVIFCFAY